MYRSLKNECQEKNRIFGRTNFFLESFRSTLECLRSSNCAKMPCDCECNSGERVMPGVRHHARPETLSLDGENAKHRAVRGDGDHSTESFIAVRGSEEQRRDKNTEPEFPVAWRADGRELLKKITAEDKFLDDAGGDTEHEPGDDL